jgi:hypothetical protein
VSVASDADRRDFVSSRARARRLSAARNDDGRRQHADRHHVLTGQLFGAAVSGDITRCYQRPNAGNSQISQVTTVTTSADLAITNVQSSAAPRAGTNQTYTLTLTNNGPSDAAAVPQRCRAGEREFVSLPAPRAGRRRHRRSAAWAVSASSSTLAMAPASFTMTVRVGLSIAARTPVNSTASVSSATTDPRPGTTASALP